MKSKLTLIILCLIIIVLGGIAVYLGLNTNKSRDDVNELTSKVEELTKNLEEKEQTIENVKNALETNKEEKDDIATTSNVGKVKFYFNDDESIMLMLAEYDDRAFGTAKASSTDVHYFAYDELEKQGIANQVMGSYYINNGKINFYCQNNFQMGKMSVSSSPNSNGGQTISIDYDENSDVITIGNVTLKQKK